MGKDCANLLSRPIMATAFHQATPPNLIPSIHLPLHQAPLPLQHHLQGVMLHPSPPLSLCSIMSPDPLGSPGMVPLLPNCSSKTCSLQHDNTIYSVFVFMRLPNYFLINSSQEKGFHIHVGPNFTTGNSVVKVL